MTPKILTMTEEAVQPTVVCNGWGLDHPEIVLTAGDANLPKSHGMCKKCQLYMNAAIDTPPDALEQYRAYLESPIDPRD